MHLTNYYKVILGSLAAHTLTQAIFPFADSDPETARLALNRARAAVIGDETALSVWKRTAVVPGYIPEVGEVVKWKMAGGERANESGEE